MGVPEMRDFWRLLSGKIEAGTATRDEIKQFKRLSKTLEFLQINPKHNSLSTHKIDSLSEKYSVAIWCSYIQNNTPSAERLFWMYGPSRNVITILAYEKHPEDTEHGYVDLPISWPET